MTYKIKIVYANQNPETFIVTNLRVNSEDCIELNLVDGKTRVIQNWISFTVE